MSPEKSIILYDFLLVKGGAEAVTLDLCTAVDDLDLGVGFTDPNLFEQRPLDDTRMFNLTGYTGITGWQILKAALYFRYKGQRLSQYSRVIFSGGSAPLAISYCEDAIKLMYCHTPPRFIYDLKDYYLGSGSFFKRLLIKLLIRYLQPRYEQAMAQMDVIVANSINVQGRIKNYLGLDAVVVYPPCHIERFSWIEQGDFYLSTARVEAYKRVDVIVKAFLKMPDKKLVVASGGGELARLQKLAEGAPNITFTGWCPEDKLKQLMGQCIATLYMPLDEDFGISPVESMAAGKPVIGVKEGGVMETVIDGETGVLCPAQPVASDVIAAVEQLTPATALSLRVNCEHRAAQFATNIFIKKMTDLLNCSADQLQQTAARISAAK